MDAKLYRTVEIVSEKVSGELGDFTQMEVAPRGTTKSAIRKNPRLITRTGTQAKNCLANLIPGLPEATTIVHIPMKSPKGEPLDLAEWTQAFWFACDQFGVPMWTQSSVKANTFYFVAKPMFDKLAEPWNREVDGAKFAVYEALVFSEMDGSEPTVVDAPANASHDMSDVPEAVVKGIVVRVKNAPSFPVFNANQVKWGYEAPEATDGKDGSCEASDWDRTCQVRAMVLNGKLIVMRNTNVGARLLHFWASCEPLLMLRDKLTVRMFLTQRTKMEVRRLLNVLSDRVALLKYLGSLKLDDNGELNAAKRAVEEAWRANVPACKELEDRTTRFAIRLIAEKIVPSGGIEVEASVAVISNKFGVAPCEWENAKAVAWRIPLTGSNAVIPLPKNPFVRGKGMVVTAEVMERGSGDDDGDLLCVSDDPEVVELFRRNLNIEIVSGMKPDKQKAKVPLTPEAMQDMAIEQVGRAWQVGTLNVWGWKLLQLGRFEQAGEFLTLANVQPMTLKHQVELGGVPFDEVVERVCRRYRQELAKVKLAWRDASLESRKWNGPREMCDKAVTVSSHLDACWDGGVEAACEWNEAHPLQPLSLSAVARIAFGENGIVIPGSAWREAREMIREWGQYWAENANTQGDHSEIYRRATEWGKSASLAACAAMLVWRPQNAENTGFSLKWHTVFAGGRAVDVLGLHPDVAEALKDIRNYKQDLDKQVALVEALLESIQ